ncbi:transcriptional regulator with XRE-family HTH domain [Hymenobacter luteus]|uniref:Transcriptional regulator with XRE-family HTH domain n=2 Tax=Hymenobacter TaxID=89966 RepID=A0A7W9T222_9BACT|nr:MULTISPECIES: helix-turn-helix transcriptional regulator [Hymenobacter]MBB4603264.1 transcriptional regulator with XRE-family HTH domain [Hymenobacter latericoloratus]MBB6060162.1 transcriptional regulator with XRE-family HTH domain [Hymenobacter luteus]
MATLATPQLLQALRARYGLSQAQLAEYLAVSRAQVSMVEQGQRTLSAAQWSRLQPLVAVLEASAAGASVAGVPPESVDTAGREALQRRLRECTQEATRLRQELSRLRARASQHQAVLRELLPLLLPLAGATDAQPARAWLLARQSEATEELHHSGAAAQVLLELRIEALDYEAAQAALRLARAANLMG